MGSILFALVVALGLWFALREVMNANYASIVAMLIAGALSAAWTSWRWSKRSSTDEQ